MIKFFYYNERIDIPKDFDINYLKHLNDRGKISLDSGGILLRDFSGYIGEILYIPKKLQFLLQFSDIDKYKELFTHLFSSIVQHFNEDRLFQLFPTKIGLTETNSKPSPIFQLNTILKHRDSAIFALSIISRNPHRKLVEDIVYKDFQNISYIDDRILLDIVENPQNWYDNSPRKAIKTIQYNNFETIDTVENRFIKLLIEELSLIVDNLIEYAQSIPIHRIMLKGIKYELENFKKDFPIDEIGDLTVPPHNSQVLLKRDGYRELFYLYNRLHYSFKPSFFRSLDSAITLKDISSLWEYYVMSKIIEEFGEIKKQDFQDNLEVKGEIYDRASLDFKNGIEVLFQHVLSSYSNIQFRPDFYIKFKNRSSVIDAKFRVLENNRTEILKNMHYYKDGLRCGSAVAIVIGNETKGEIFLESGEVVNIHTFKDALNYRGVGYLSINLKELFN